MLITINQMIITNNVEGHLLHLFSYLINIIYSFKTYPEGFLIKILYLLRLSGYEF